MKKTFLSLFLVLFVFLLGITISVYYFLDVTRQKLFWEKKITLVLQRPVTIQEAHLQIFPQTQLILANIVIADHDGKGAFVAIERIKVGMSLRLLLSRFIRLDYLVIDRPRIAVVRMGPAELNCSDIITAFRQGLLGKQKEEKIDVYDFRVRLRALIIHGGELEFRDYTFGATPHVITVSDLDLQTNSFSMGAPVPFRMKCRLNAPERDSVFSLKGNVSLPGTKSSPADLRFAGDLEMKRVPLPVAAPYLPRWGGSEISGGVLEGKLSYQGSFRGNFTGSAKVDILNLRLHNPKLFESPLAIAKVSLGLSVEREGNTLTIPAFTLALPELKATGNARIENLSLAENFSGAAKIDVVNLKLHNPQLFESPLKIAKASLGMSISRQGSTFTIPALTLTLPELKATGNARIDGVAAPQIEAKISTDRFKYQAVAPYFPYVLFPPTVRQVLKSVIAEGTIEQVSLSFSHVFNGSSSLPAPEWLKGMRGTLQFHDFSLNTFDDCPPVRNLGGEVRFQGGDFSFSNISGLFGNTAIEQGAVTVSKTGFLDLSASFNLELLDLFTLAKSQGLPPHIRHHFENLTALSGPAHLAVNASVPLNNPDALTLGGRLEVKNATLDYRPFRKMATNVRGSVLFTPYTISLQGFEGFWADSSFHCAGEIENYRSDNARIAIHVTSGKASINNLASAFFPWKDVEGRGSVNIDVDFQCRGYRSANLNFNGQAALADLFLKFSALPKPFEEITGGVTFSSEGLRFSNISLKSGSSDLLINGTWKDLRHPVLSGTIEGAFVDGMDFYKPKEPEPEKKPSNYTVDNILVHIAKGRYKNLAFEDLITTINLRDEVLTLPALKIGRGLYRDLDFLSLSTSSDSRENPIRYQKELLSIPYVRLESKGGYWVGKDIVWPLGREGTSVFSMSAEANNVPVEEFMEGFPPEKRRLITGTLNLHCSVSSTGNTWGERMKHLRGQFDVRAEKGVLRKATVLSKLFSLLNVSRVFSQDYSKLFIEGISYNSIEGSFNIDEGVARTEDLSFDSTSLIMRAVGDVDLGNNLLDGEIAVKPLETVDKILGKIPLLGSILMGDEGAFFVSYYKIKGPFKNPDIRAMVFESLGRKAQGIFMRIFKLPGKILNPVRKNGS